MLISVSMPHEDDLSLGVRDCVRMRVLQVFFFFASANAVDVKCLSYSGRWTIALHTSKDLFFPQNAIMM